MTQIKLFKADDPWGDRMLEEQVNQFLQENLSTINVLKTAKRVLQIDKIYLFLQIIANLLAYVHFFLYLCGVKYERV